MYYTVYILESIRFLNRHYVGHSDNVERRLNEHNAGKTKSIAKYLPMKIIYTEQYPTKTEAYRRESQIKSYKGGRAFKKLLEEK